MFQKRIHFRGGFTLVEILAVVVILGIASAVIIPQIGSRGDLKASAAARTIVADLIYAQNLAISTGTMTYVKFDVTNNKYSLLTGASSAKSGGGDAVTHPMTQLSYVTQFGSTVRGWEDIALFSAVFNGVNSAYRPEYTIAFDELGTPYIFDYTANASDEMYDEGQIVVKAGTFSNTIKVSPATGEIQVQ